MEGQMTEDGRRLQDLETCARLTWNAALVHSGETRAVLARVAQRYGMERAGLGLIPSPARSLGDVL